MRPILSTFAKVAALTFALLLTVPMTGCGKGKKIPGLENLSITVIHKRLYVNFLATQLQWDYGITVPIPWIYDSTVGIAPSLATPGTIFQVGISLEAVLNHNHPFPLAGLPDGRAIPDIDGGQLPRWDTQIKNLTLSIYLSDDAFGLFVPITLKTNNGYELPWLVSVKIEDERGNVLGKAYAIPSNVSGSGSGVFLLLPYLGGTHPAGSSN